MAMKAADFLHVGRGTYLLDRLQNVGPSGLNVPTEVIKEVGNYKSVATIRDIPDLSFSLQSYDVTTELEKMLTNTSTIPGGGLDMSTCSTLDLVGQVKPGALATTPFAVVRSVATPLLYPERVSYRFAVQQNSTVDVTLRGDQINYCPGTAYVQTLLGSGLTSNAVTLTNAAGLYTTSSGDSRVLAVSVNGQRQIEGTDFVVTISGGAAAFNATTVTFQAGSIPASTDKISIVYFSNVAATFNQATHPTASTKPAAIKGRDVRLYIGASYNPASVAASAGFRWSGVQSVNVDWAVNVLKDYELGNANATTVEPEDVPTVNGSVSLRARNAAELFTRLRQITGVTNIDKAIGPDNAVELPVDIVVLDSAGTVYKRLNIPDARFSLPGYSAQVGQRVDVEMSFTSDSGSLFVFDA